VNELFKGYRWNGGGEKPELDQGFDELHARDTDTAHTRAHTHSGVGME